ncbi:cytochrome P450, partial [Mycena epipterygia]
AGRDTAMHTLTMVIYLSLHHVSRSLRPVLAHVGPTRRPTYDDIRDMKYLRAVIEGAYMLPCICREPSKENVNATVWPSPDPNEKPLYLPAGSKILCSVFMMHRRTDLWGPDVEEFSPDSFLDERLKAYLLKNSFQFLPFNACPRICLGQQARPPLYFAYKEMSFMIIRLLQAFSSFSLDEDAFAPEASGRTHRDARRLRSSGQAAPVDFDHGKLI